MDNWPNKEDEATREATARMLEPYKDRVFRTPQDADNALLVRALVADVIDVEKRKKCGMDVRFLHANGGEYTMWIENGMPAMDDHVRAALRRALGEE